MQHFFDAVDALSLAFVLPVLIKLWSMTPAQVGILIGMVYIGQLLGRLVLWLACRAQRPSQKRHPGCHDHVDHGDRLRFYG